MKTQLKENEEVVLTIRKHWLVLLQPTLGAIILLAIAAVAGVYGADTAYGNIILVGAGITIVLTLLWFLYRIMDRNNNLWAVTNLRVIDEYGVFTNNSKETPLDKINNVSYRQPLLGRIFNYGDVQIQSAAEAGATIHRMVARPKVLKDMITLYQEEYRKLQIREQAQYLVNSADKKAPASEYSISEEITRLHDLKEKGIISEDDFQKLKDKLLNDWHHKL
jgi:uncharacterized membrane protein YdbT with pleckstrin-like domain